jgi:hypothetical protein
MPFILAHSGGIRDEFIFVGIAIAFTIFMAIGWWRSRDFGPELEDEEDGGVES